MEEDGVTGHGLRRKPWVGIETFSLFMVHKGVLSTHFLLSRVSEQLGRDDVHQTFKAVGAHGLKGSC